MALQGAEDGAEVVERLGVVRPQLQGPTVASLGLGRTPAAPEDHAEVVMGQGMIRLQFHGSPVTGLGIGAAPEFLEQHAEVVMGLRGVRLEAERSRNAVSASASRPSLWRTAPRLLWKSATPGAAITAWWK